MSEPTRDEIEAQARRLIEHAGITPRTDSRRPVPSDDQATALARMILGGRR